MPYAITHVLVVIIFLELFRSYLVKNKKAFPLHYVLAGGIAGLLPDFDVAAFYLLSFFGFSIQEVHRTFTHTLFLPLFFFLAAVVSYRFKSKKLGEHHLKLRNILFVIAFGTFMHLVLDAGLRGTIMPLFPLSNFSVGLNLVSLFPTAWQDSIIPSIEAIVFIIWLASLEIRHKISSFI